MKSVLSFVAAALLVAYCQGCQQGFEKIGDECLAFHLGSAYNWTEADIVCAEEYGGILAKVNSASTLRAVYEYIITYGLTDSYWLGGTDHLSEGDWLWIYDGSRVEKATPFWALHTGLLGGFSHEPSGGRDENCLLLNKKKKYFFTDEDCSNPHHLICMQL